MAGAMDRWHEQVVLLMKQRGILESVLLRMTNLAMAGALDRWISNVKETKRQARVLERVVQRLLTGALVSTFERWRDHIIEEKQIRSNAWNVVRRWHRVQEAAVARCKMKKIKAEIQILLREFSFQISSRDAQAKQTALNVVQRLLHGTLASAFQRWKDHSNEIQQEMKYFTSRLNMLQGTIDRTFEHMQIKLVSHFRRRKMRYLLVSSVPCYHSLRPLSLLPF
jgi:hypothetical protein